MNSDALALSVGGVEAKWVLLRVEILRLKRGRGDFGAQGRPYTISRMDSLRGRMFL